MARKKAEPKQDAPAVVNPLDEARAEQAENAEPLGYVDPAAQGVPEGYAPDPADVENPQPKAAVTRADVKGDADNG